MTILQTINIGNYENDGTGDDLRVAFQKVNNNFSNLSNDVTNAVNVGAGAGVFSQKSNTVLQFKSLHSSDDSVTFTQTTTDINMTAVARVANDPNPMLSNNLILNGFNIKSLNNLGHIESRIYDVDVQLLNYLVLILLSSGTTPFDLGTILTPAGKQSSLIYPLGYGIDLGSFINPTISYNLDFGKY